MNHDRHKQHPNPRTKEREEIRRNAEIQARRELREVFGTETGKRVLARLRAAAGVDRPRFRTAPDGKGPNALHAAFYDGQASVILEIERKLQEPEDEEKHRPSATA